MDPINSFLKGKIKLPPLKKAELIRDRIFASCLTAFVIFSFMLIFINTASDFVWFKSVGYSDVFLRKIFARSILAIFVFLITYSALYVYFRLIYRNATDKLDLEIQESEILHIKRYMRIIAFTMAFFFSMYATYKNLFSMLEFIYGEPFFLKDPVFKLDIGFYIFRLPLITALFNMAIYFIVLMTVCTSIFYLRMTSRTAPFTSLETDGTESYEKMYAFKANALRLFFSQLRLMGGALFTVVGAQNFLKCYELLYSPTGAVFGAGYTDIAVKLKVYIISAVTSFVVAFILATVKENIRPKVIFCTLLIIGVNIGGGIVVNMAQTFIVSPDEIRKEEPFIKNAIFYTKAAYGLDKIDEDVLNIAYDEQNPTVNQCEDILDNMILQDAEVLKETLNSRSDEKNCYVFSDTDMDRYNDRQVIISARESDVLKLPGKAQNWTNVHLKYTHGYGAVIIDAGRIKDNKLLWKIPVKSEISDLNLTRPEIYYGENTLNYVITNTKEDEFDYPLGDGWKFTDLKNMSGIPMNFFNRVLFSLKTGDGRILFSRAIKNDSRLLIYRDALTRAKKIAPFLTYDEDICPVVSDGKLYFIIDAYTEAETFPYSERAKGRNSNYIRNSCKAVLDCYSGEINFYITENEPIIQTYAGIFPNLFKPLSLMPEDIRAHIKYPKKLFDIQSSMYATFHGQDAYKFYNLEDAWEIPTEKYNNDTENLTSFNCMIKLKGETKSEFAGVSLYVPKGGENLTAMLTVRADGINYGDFKAYRIKSVKPVLGPMQAENRLSGDEKIMSHILNLDKRGFDTLRGHISPVFTGNSLIYIEPLYIKEISDYSPSIDSIMATYDDNTVISDTPENLINKMFVPATENNPIMGMDYKDKINSAKKLYTESQQALKKGDLAEYQKKNDEIGKIINSIE